MRKTFFSFIAITAAFTSLSQADVISGVVSSAADSSKLAQVRVSSDSTHFTLTATDGSFTLTTAGGTGIASSPSGRAPELLWNASAGFFSWTGYSGKASLELRDTQGLLVTQTTAGSCCADLKFSLSGLPAGIYFATLKTPDQTVTRKIFNMNPRHPVVLSSRENGSGPLAKTAAIDTLTFVKTGYTQVTRVLNGSQTGVLVQMQPASKIKYIFVVAMENTDASSIYGNRTNAPYINDSLVANYANGSNFGDELPLSIVSEPHYIWMEAGTNAFSDHTFPDDADPSATVSTNSTAHLVTQIKNARNGSDWMAYQEDINATTGTCPIATNGFYAPKHDPFVFFQDVAGSPPSKTNAYCTAHHKPLTSLAADLASRSVKSYNFITPNQCHDMHGQSGCPSGNIILAGDNWLRANLPPLIAFASANAGVIFLTWDEGSSTSLMAFLVIGPGAKRAYNSTIMYNHGSMLKSVERILQLPILPTVTSQTDFTDFFTTGNYP